MDTRKNMRYALIIVAALAAVGLGLWALGLPGASGAAAGLEGRTWRLASIDGRPPAPGSAATISFAGGKVAGTTGVNQFGGSYRASGDTIALAELASTMMASADPALNDQEQKLLGVLQGQLTYRVAGAQLTLSSPAGTLIYTA